MGAALDEGVSGFGDFGMRGGFVFILTCLRLTAEALESPALIFAAPLMVASPALYTLFLGTSS